MIAYLKLMRISALPTLWANTLTAFCLVCSTRTGTVFPSESGFLPVWCVLGASTFFYLTGMVLNDFFDAKIDAVERPERVIPSGRIPRWAAGVFGFALLICAWICVEACFRLHETSLLYQTALILTICVVGYDAFLKRIPFSGPIAMGACRFFNIFFVLVFSGGVDRWSQLGSISHGRFDENLFYPWLVGMYVAVLTILSRYEVESPKIRRLVDFGMAMLIPLDALMCLIFIGPGMSAVILCLFPIAMGLRRIVPMT